MAIMWWINRSFECFIVAILVLRYAYLIPNIQIEENLCKFDSIFLHSLCSNVIVYNQVYVEVKDNLIPNRSICRERENYSSDYFKVSRSSGWWYWQQVKSDDTSSDNHWTSAERRLRLVEVTSREDMEDMGSWDLSSEAHISPEYGGGWPGVRTQGRDVTQGGADWVLLWRPGRGDCVIR